MGATSGELIGGRYRLVEPVGQGGMGRVWRGRDETLHREVALKEILFPAGSDDSKHDVLLRRVIREARTAAALNHPGIITVHDVVEHNGAPVIVMEFVAGMSLAAAIREQGRLPVRRVAEIGLAVLDALAVAHAAGIVHRDLKPDNILLTDRRVVLTDFGIAGISDATTALTGSGAILGTPLYLAPEQLDGKPATPASDLWSLGATLYTAVEGGPPFDAPTLAALYMAILTRAPRSTRHAGQLAPALTGLLAKDVTRRATAAQTIAALAACSAPVPAGPEPAEPRERVHHEEPRPPRHAGPRTVLATQPSAPPLDQLPTESLAAGTRGTAVPRQPKPGDPARGKPAGSPTDDGPPRPASTGKPRRRAVLFAGLGTLATVAVPAAVYLSRPDDDRVSTLGGHAGPVLSVAFSPNGKTLASGSADNTVRLWDVAERRTTATLAGHTTFVESVAFSPDGKLLATAGADDTGVWLRDLSSGHTVTLTGHTESVKSVAFSPDGKLLASGSRDRTVRLWDLTTGQTTATLTGHTHGVLAVRFSPDGKTLAGGASDDAVRLWDVATGRATATLTALTTVTSPNGGVSSLAFGPDGKLLAGGGTDGVRLWEVATGRTTVTLTGLVSRVESVAFSPDGRTLAGGGSDGTGVWLWDVSTGRSTATLTGHTDTVLAVAFSPDGKLLASGSADKTARLWKVP